jgi:hypothetical protein
MRSIVFAANLALCAPLLAGGVWLAHATPPKFAGSFSEGARFDIAPAGYVLTFNKPMRLSKVRLVDQDGEEIVLAALSRPVKIHFIELPVLPPHGYRLFWESDWRGQATGGNVGFVISGCAREEAVPPPVAHGA